MSKRRKLDHVHATSAQCARSYRSMAGGDTRRAERDARRADEFYAIARRNAARAAWLTQRPSLWMDDYTPEHYESMARTFERVGDTFLHSSFHATEQAQFHRDLAARYAERA